MRARGGQERAEARPHTGGAALPKPYPTPDHSGARARLGRQPLLVDHLGAHGRPRLLVQLVSATLTLTPLGCGGARVRRCLNPTLRLITAARGRASGASPFWSTISARTAAQGSLSSLSMAEQMGRNLAAGTPHVRIIASSSRRWLSLMRKRPMSSAASASASTCARAHASPLYRVPHITIAPVRARRSDPLQRRRQRARACARRHAPDLTEPARLPACRARRRAHVAGGSGPTEGWAEGRRRACTCRLAGRHSTFKRLHGRCEECSAAARGMQRSVMMGRRGAAHADDLRVGGHARVCARDVQVALEELAHAPARHLRAAPDAA